MALKSTIFKAELDLADVDRNYYQAHSLRLARHSSETDERMMVRLLAFACHAHERLTFTEGLAQVDEPALWQKDLTGLIELWIEVGQPDEKRILKACGRADQVVVYTYSNSSLIWWNQLASKLERARNLTVYHVPESAVLARLAERTMKLHCTLQEGSLWWTAGDDTLLIERVKLR
jgi:uncharacterized protein YaeQ